MSTIYDDGFLYDALFGHDDGIEFYMALAAQHPGPVLELGAGTGRIAIPLAKRGFSVTAVELSHTMLETGKEKAEEEGVTIGLPGLKTTSVHIGRPSHRASFS